MSKIQCFGCNEYGNFKRYCPNNKTNKMKERGGAHIIEEKEEFEKNPKGEDPKNIYY